MKAIMQWAVDGHTTTVDGLQTQDHMVALRWLAPLPMDGDRIRIVEEGDKFWDYVYRDATGWQPEVHGTGDAFAITHRFIPPETVEAQRQGRLHQAQLETLSNVISHLRWSALVAWTLAVVFLITTIAALSH
jgi:hypothetical protein